MKDLETGVVKFFNPAADKRFGFVVNPADVEIFFHEGDFAQLTLGQEKGEIQPVFMTGAAVAAPRNPRKGDKLLFSEGHGKKGKGPKASPWGFAEGRERLMALGGRIQQKRHWAEPTFVGFKTEFTSGWGPTIHYAYFPNTEGAEEAGLHVQRFDTLLLYKSGEVVVTGRTVRRGNDGEFGWSTLSSKEPAEPVHGIIPVEAEDGFYFWNGQKWEKCEEVEVHVTRVIVGNTETPARYRFLGLRTASGVLVPNQDKFVYDQEFISLRKIEADEAMGLPVVKTAVHKDGWFTTEEKLKWCEPRITKGISPEFGRVLNRLAEATVTKSRPDKDGSGVTVVISCGSERVTVEVIKTVTIPFNPREHGQYYTLFIERTDGQTFTAVEGLDESDSRLTALVKRLDSVEAPVTTTE